MPHAYAIEFVQLIAALIGGLLNLFTLHEASVSLKSENAVYLPDRIRVLWARGRVEQERVRLIVQALLVLLGFIAIVSPPPFLDGASLAQLPIELRRNLVITRLVLTVISCLMLYKSFSDLTTSRALVRTAVQLAIEREREIAAERSRTTAPERRSRMTPIDFAERRGRNDIE